MRLPSLQRAADGASERALPGLPVSSPAPIPGFVTVPAAVLEDYVTLSAEKARDAVLRASFPPSEAELLDGEERFRAWGGFFWSSGAYEHAGFRHRYVQELFVPRARLAFDALAAADAAFPPAFSHLRAAGAGAPPPRVVSCGAGPGCDLFGADLFLRVFYPRARRDAPSPTFTAVDSQPAWSAACSAGLGYRFVCADYRGEHHGGGGGAGDAAVAGADLVVLSHVLTDFAPDNTKTFMKAVLAKMNPRGRVLVLDRDDVWPGRPPKPPSARIDGATDRALLFWSKGDAAMTAAAGIAPPAKPRNGFRQALGRFAGLIPNHR